MCKKSKYAALPILVLLVCVSLQIHSTEESLKKAVAEGQRRALVVAQRGKSMEELGTSKITRLPVISRSSEQLDQLRSSDGPAPFSRETREVSARGQGRDGNAEDVPQQEEPGTGPITQGHTPNQTQRRSNPDPGEDLCVPTRASSGSTSPTSPSSWRISPLPASHSLPSSRPPSETLSNPPSPRGLEAGEGGSRSVPLSPTQTKAPCESRCGTR